MSRDKKVLVLGIDGMDFRITKKFLDEGKLPNIKKYLERGAARTGLDMLGSNPDDHSALLDNTSNRSLSGNPRNHLLLETVSGFSGCCSL